MLRNSDGVGGEAADHMVDTAAVVVVVAVVLDVAEDTPVAAVVVVVVVDGVLRMGGRHAHAEAPYIEAGDTPLARTDVSDGGADSSPLRPLAGRTA